MNGAKLRVGFIGAGDVVTRFHLPGWHRLPGIEYVAVADVNTDRAAEVARGHGIGQVFADYHDLLDRRDIDVVDICVPNRLHALATLASLQSGKHVLCEKPLATTPDEVREVIAAARSAGRLLCAMQNHRFRGISQAVREWVAAGHLGRAYYARAWALRRNYLPCAPGFIRRELSGGGVCMDMGVHCLDLAMYLLDFPEPVAVCGMAGTFLAREPFMPGGWGEWERDGFDLEDFAAAMVRFRDGLTLSLETSWLSHIPEREVISCTLLGTRAGVSWPSGAVATVRDHQLADRVLDPLPELERGHWAVIERFADAILSGKPSPVPAEESLTVIRILDGVYRSQAEGREVAV
jgi:predicted dehydrogenase